MRKITLLAFIVCVMASGVAVAQKTIGGHVGYGTEVERFAIGINSEFFVNDKISVAPNFTFYFPKKDEASFTWFGYTTKATTKYTFWELNIDGHYYFTENDAPTAFYALAGINILGSKWKATVKYEVPPGEPQPQSESESDSNTDVGLNLGAGVNFNTGSKLKPFAELKYETVGDGQLVIMAGLRFPIGN